jgi:hypothetical protein
MNIILYTIDCPRCKVLEKKLQQKGINYSICNDIKIMTEKNIQELPVLSIDEKLYQYKEAINWINGGK